MISIQLISLERFHDRPEAEGLLASSRDILLSVCEEEHYYSHRTPSRVRSYTSRTWVVDNMTGVLLTGASVRNPS